MPTSVEFDAVLKQHYIEPILEQLHSRSPLLEWVAEERDRKMDWGFDSIYPRAVKQPWFKEWEEKVRGGSPYRRAMSMRSQVVER